MSLYVYVPQGLPQTAETFSALDGLVVVVGPYSSFVSTA